MDLVLDLLLAAILGLIVVAGAPSVLLAGWRRWSATPPPPGLLAWHRRARWGWVALGALVIGFNVWLLLVAWPTPYG